MLKLKFSLVVILVKFLILTKVCATTLTDFEIISNTYNKSLILLNFDGNSVVYSFHIVHRPERLVLDISYVVLSRSLKEFPINFSDGKLIQCIRVDKLTDGKSIRFIFDLICLSCVDDVFLEKVSGFDKVLFVVTRDLSLSVINPLDIKKRKKYFVSPFKTPILEKGKNPNISYVGETSKSIFLYQRKNFSIPFVVAIDAGHGGTDPGAKGHSGLYEKNITIAIAKKFKVLLDQDPLFSPVMIRDGDYFISVSERSELARSKGANILLSIHADAISKKHLKNNIRGASVWILSNHRANIEIAYWLKNSNRWSRLIGTPDILIGSTTSSDYYFHRAILDLQFSHSQKIGYEIAWYLLQSLKNVSVLHKYMPEYSNFGILRSLDIPSVLIETGFMTHPSEEKLLATDSYQKRIAYALYKGLRSYFLEHISYFEKKITDKLYANS